eukprot:IDg21811t1
MLFLPSYFFENTEVSIAMRLPARLEAQHESSMCNIFMDQVQLSDTLLGATEQLDFDIVIVIELRATTDF